MATLLGACTIVGLDAEQRLGVIDWDGMLGRVPFEIPDTVDAGVDFTVTVVTRGSSSCTHALHTYVLMDGSAALVVPVDVEDVGGLCTADLGSILHHATIRFRAPGEATVTVRGRRLGVGDVTEWVDTVWVR